MGRREGEKGGGEMRGEYEEIRERIEGRGRRKEEKGGVKVAKKLSA